MMLTALVGLFASIYLLVVYTSNAPILCGVGSGCDVVRASEWAYVLDGIPRPLLGVIFYSGLIALLVVRTAMPQWFTKWLYWLTMLAATVGILESIHLFWIQYALIEAFCNWCLVSGVSTLVIFAVAFGDRRTVLTHDESLAELQWQLITLTAAFVAGVVGLWWLL